VNIYLLRKKTAEKATEKSDGKKQQKERGKRQ